MGFALIPMEEKKQPVLALLDALTEALMGIASFVSRLAPLGVFALVGVAAGTMRVDEFIRLQVYIYSYVTLALLLSFWIVPGLVTVLLPISYRELMRSAQTALITAFATGSLLVALPLVAEGVKKAMAEAGTRSRDAQSAVDVVVPVNFTLPNLGKLLGLAFVPFAGWLTGFEMSAGQYPVLLASGLFSMFAEVVALPFLLDLMRIPADTFQLFVALDVSTGRFGQMLAGAHTFALALLIGGAVAGLLELRRPAMIRYILITGLLLIVTLGGLRLLYEYGSAQRVRARRALQEHGPRGGARGAHRAREAASWRRHARASSRLDQVVARGVLRVGYLADSLPNVFVNSESELVGLDVDLASLMARDIGVDLEFVTGAFPR